MGAKNSHRREDSPAWEPVGLHILEEDLPRMLRLPAIVALPRDGEGGMAQEVMMALHARAGDPLGLAEVLEGVPSAARVPMRGAVREPRKSFLIRDVEAWRVFRTEHGEAEAPYVIAHVPDAAIWARGRHPGCAELAAAALHVLPASLSDDQPLWAPGTEARQVLLRDAARHFPMDREVQWRVREALRLSYFDGVVRGNVLWLTELAEVFAPNAAMICGPPEKQAELCQAVTAAARSAAATGEKMKICDALLCAGAAELVTSAARTLEGQFVVQKAACEAMEALAALGSDFAGLAAALMGSGAPRLLVAAMLAHPKNVKLQETACGAVGHLAAMSEANREAFLALGGVPELVAKAQECHASHREVQETARFALGSLASSGAGWEVEASAA